MHLFRPSEGGGGVRGGPLFGNIALQLLVGHELQWSVMMSALVCNALAAQTSSVFVMSVKLTCFKNMFSITTVLCCCVKLAVTDGCRPHIRQLLLAHGVIVESDIDDAHEDAHTAHPGCRAFDHMEAGLQYCEERFLEVRPQPCLALTCLACCLCCSAMPPSLNRATGQAAGTAVQAAESVLYCQAILPGPAASIP